MPLDKDRLISLELQTEGLRYVKTPKSDLSPMRAYEPPPRPKVDAKQLATEAEEVAVKFEKLAADSNAAWAEGERLHDKLYGAGIDLSDVPGRPQLAGSSSYPGAGEDIRNDCVTVAGWYRVFAAKLREAPKIPEKK